MNVGHGCIQAMAQQSAFTVRDLIKTIKGDCIISSPSCTVLIARATHIYEGTDWYNIIACPQSQQLLDFLLKRFNFHTGVLQLVLKNACFWPNDDPDSLIVKICADLIVQTPNYTGPRHRRHIVDFNFVYQACPSCSPVGPLGGSISVVVVQLRQHGTHKLARLNLERHILRHPTLSSGLMNFKKI